MTIINPSNPKNHIDFIKNWIVLPLFDSVEEYINYWKKQPGSADSSFQQNYLNNVKRNISLTSNAKGYILNNWEKIQDWSELSVVIKDVNNLHETIYHKWERKVYKKESILSKLMQESNDKEKELHNPITEIGYVTLDVNGDFSIKINGNHHRSIDDSSVITIATYIENKLKNEQSRIR